MMGESSRILWLREVGSIVSTRSGIGVLEDLTDDTVGSTVKRGTSMATPIVAGSAALVIEHLNNMDTTAT